MAETSRNKHHTVPRSFFGSSDPVNLTKINELVHSQFHYKFGHPTPDIFLRHLVLMSIKTTGRTPAIDVVQESLRLLTIDDWRALYRHEAFVSFDKVKPMNTAKTARHLSAYAKAEWLLTDQAVGKVSGMNGFPYQLKYASHTVEEFFNEESPIKAARTFLTHKNQEGYFVYANALHPSIHSKLLDIIPKNPTLYRLHGKFRMKMIDVLLEHEDDIILKSRMWYPQQDSYYEQLAQLGDNVTESFSEEFRSDQSSLPE